MYRTCPARARWGQSDRSVARPREYFLGGGPAIGTCPGGHSRGRCRATGHQSPYGSFLFLPTEILVPSSLRGWFYPRGHPSTVIVVVLFAEPLSLFRRFFVIPFRPLNTSFRRSPHGPTPCLSLSPLDGEDLPPSRTAGAQRCYPYWNALAGGPDAATTSREKTLNCERQVQVRARRSALQCPLTADMGPNETMQRDQELDRINGIPRPLSPSPQRPTFRISHLPNDPKQVDVPREPAPLPIPAFC